MKFILNSNSKGGPIFGGLTDILIELKIKSDGLENNIRTSSKYYYSILDRSYFQVFKSEKFRNLYLGKEEYNDELIEKLYLKVKNPKLNKQLLTKREHWLIFFLVNKLLSLEGFNITSSTKIIADKLRRAPESTRARYQERKASIIANKLEEEKIKIEFGLHTRIQEFWNEIKWDLMVKGINVREKNQ